MSFEKIPLVALKKTDRYRATLHDKLDKTSSGWRMKSTLQCGCSQNICQQKWCWIVTLQLNKFSLKMTLAVKAYINWQTYNIHKQYIYIYNKISSEHGMKGPVNYTLMMSSYLIKYVTAIDDNAWKRILTASGTKKT